MQDMKETQVRSLGQEDPLEQDNPLQYSCLENEIERRLVGYCPWGHKESNTIELTRRSITLVSNKSSRGMYTDRPTEIVNIF